jgi:hypothetical protein
MITSHHIFVTLWIHLIPSLPPYEYFSSHPCRLMNPSHPIITTRWILLIPFLSPYYYFSSHPCHQMNTIHSILANRWEMHPVKGSINQDKLLRIRILNYHYLALPLYQKREAWVGGIAGWQCSCDSGGSFLCVEQQYNSEPRSRFHIHTISLRFLSIILRVLRFEVSLWIS